MKKIWNYLSNQGLTDELDSRLRRKIRLTNQITITMCMLMVFFFPFAYKNVPILFWSTMFFGLIYIVPTIANHFHFYNFSRFFLLIYAVTIMLIVGSLETDMINTSRKFAYISIIIIPLLLFDVTERSKMYSGIAIVLAGFIMFDFVNAIIPKLPAIDAAEVDNPTLVIVNGLISFIMFTISFNYFQNMNYKAEEKLLEQNIVLEKQKAELTDQSENLETANKSITQQRNLIQTKNQQIIDSIAYAQNIQGAVLPGEQIIQAFIPENFILNKPKDIVSGDFYFVKQVYEYLFIAAGDCTGHGVPGSLMTILGLSFLNELVTSQQLTETNEILNELRERIKVSLHQTGEDNDTKDGMDIALCAINMKQKTMQFSGAYNPLIQISNGKLIEHKADRMPIGVYPKEGSFGKTEIDYKPDDIFYLFSDGFIDQFGGNDGGKYKSKQFKDLLLEIHDEPMYKQQEELEAVHNQWRGTKEQTDDILVIGFKIG